MTETSGSYPPELGTVTYKPLRVRFQQIFGRYTIEKAKYSMEPFMEHIADEIALRIELEILGQENIQTYSVEVDVPNTWRDQFLREMRWKWLSGLLQRIRPIKWRTVTRDVTFNHWMLLPKFDKVPPGEEYVMVTQPPTEPGITKKES